MGPPPFIDDSCVIGTFRFTFEGKRVNAEDTPGEVSSSLRLYAQKLRTDPCSVVSWVWRTETRSMPSWDRCACSFTGQKFAHLLRMSWKGWRVRNLCVLILNRSFLHEACLSLLLLFARVILTCFMLLIFYIVYQWFVPYQAMNSST